MSQSYAPRYNRVPANFWTSKESAEWSDRERLAAMYLMTCSHRTSEGIFQLNGQYGCADLRWTMKSWRSVFAVLEESHFLKWDSHVNVILLKTALKDQAPENPNQVASALRRINALPETPLLNDFYDLVLAKYEQNPRNKAAQLFAEQLRELLQQRFAQELPPLILLLEPLLDTQKATASSWNKSMCRKSPRNVSTGLETKPDERMQMIGDPLKILSSNLRESFAKHLKEEP